MLNAYSLGGMVSASEVIEFLKGVKNSGKCEHYGLGKIIKELEENHMALLSVKASRMPYDIKQMIEKGSKVEAIKELYSLWKHDLSLVECKDVCDRYHDSLVHLAEVKKRNAEDNFVAELGNLGFRDFRNL